jgi:hypothetical protein
MQEFFYLEGKKYFERVNQGERGNCKTRKKCPPRAGGGPEVADNTGFPPARERLLWTFAIGSKEMINAIVSLQYYLYAHFNFLNNPSMTRYLLGGIFVRKGNAVSLTNRTSSIK